MGDPERETDASMREAVARLRGVRRRQVRRLALVRGCWVALALGILLFYLDAVVQWGGPVRLGLNAVVLAAILGTIVLTFWRLSRAVSRDKMLARLIESDHPEVGNDLTNAIDFENRLDGHDAGGASPSLMRKGIERGARSFAGLAGMESLRPPTLPTESYVLVGVLAACVLAALVFSGWMFAELPRFLSPLADHPPYSATQLVVTPAGATVDYGESLTVSVTTRGREPKDVSLQVKGPNDEQVSTISMFKSQDGRYFQTIENIRSELTYWAGIKRGRSKYYRIALNKAPKIESVQVRYRYPAYSRLPDRDAVLNEAESVLKAYRGTEVTMTAASNRPLRGGTVNVGGRTYPCAPQPDNTVQVVFPLTAEGAFSLTVTDVEGNTCKAPFKGTVTIVPDNRPMISIVSPAVQSLAIPTARIPVVIEAQDDLGIGDISIFRSHNESDDARKHLLGRGAAGQSVSVVEMLDLADLGVRPGDVIDFYATATDSLPESPQTAASEPHQLQIISEEEFAQMMRNQMTAKDLRLKYDDIISRMNKLVAAQEQLSRETQALRESLPQTSDASLSRDKQEQLQDLQRRQEELGKQTQSLAQKLAEESQSPPVFDIEKDYKEFVGEFSRQMTTAGGHMANSAQEMQEGSQAPGQGPARLADAAEEQQKALEALGAQTREMQEKIRQANRELEKMMDLLTDVEMFKALYTAQKHLTRETKSYSEVEAEDLETRVRLKELAERETSTREQLDTLKGRFREHAARIAQEYPQVAADANQIAEEIEQRRITGLMQAGAAFLNRGSGVQGYPNVLEALKQMAAMISFCESAGGKACENCRMRLRIQMMLNPGDTLGQLAQGLGMGMGMGLGLAGAFGQGAAGTSGGRSDMDVFGNDTFGRDMTTESSRFAGAPRKEVESVPLPGQRDPLAGNIEELSPQSKRDTESDVQGDSRMMAEYRQLIEAYFQRLAESQ